MKIDKTIVYTFFLGVFCGVLSNNYHYQDIISLGVPIFLYLIFSFCISKTKRRSFKKIVNETITIFLLSWFIFWTILFNLSSF